MADLVVIVPSRGRPEAAAELAVAFRETCTADTRLWFALDDDDERLGEYRSILQREQRLLMERHAAMDLSRKEASRLIAWVSGTHRTMVEALNDVANQAAARGSAGKWAFAIGFMGDDHRPRTSGWDTAYLAALHIAGTGIVYGNDLLQGHRLPTQCAMTADIVRALGYMAPPMLRHLYVDNYWRDLGKSADCLRYLPQVTIEHRHPLAGKAQWDEGYLRVNAQEVATHDAQAYEAFAADGLDADVAKVRALR